MDKFKNFTYVNCLCCGTKIELYDAKDNPHFDVVDFMRQHQPGKSYMPESQVWENGIIDRLDAGYGSINDGNMYYMGICDTCVKENTDNGRLRFAGSYLGFKIYSETELTEFEKKRTRENNLNLLTETTTNTEYKIKVIKRNWIEVKKDDIDTYPSEGIDVLVSDGYNHDVAYYLMSGEYKWMKVNIKNDESNEFTDFVIKKWKYID